MLKISLKQFDEKIDAETIMDVAIEYITETYRTDNINITECNCAYAMRSALIDGFAGVGFIIFLNDNITYDYIIITR